MSLSKPFRIINYKQQFSTRRSTADLPRLLVQYHTVFPLTFSHLALTFPIYLLAENSPSHLKEKVAQIISNHGGKKTRYGGEWEYMCLSCKHINGISSNRINDENPKGNLIIGMLKWSLHFCHWITIWNLKKKWKLFHYRNIVRLR